MGGTITRLYYAEVDNVIWGLQRMKPRDSLTKEEIRKLIGYLQNNRERIHYRGDRIAYTHEAFRGVVG